MMKNDECTYAIDCSCQNCQDLRIAKEKFRTYYIDRYKNGNPKLIAMNFSELEVFHTLYPQFPTHDTPREAWEAFKAETKKALSELPKMIKDRQRDLKEANKKLNALKKRN